MLSQWLRWLPLDPNPFTKFTVIRVDQIHELLPEVRQHVQELMTYSKMSESFLKRVSQRLNWSETRIREQLFNRTIPREVKKKRGEFGEILTCAVLEQFSGYSIPVSKLLFKLTSGQSLPSTDALAIKVNEDGLLIEICFVESKLRTFRDTSAAAQAAKQLNTDTSVATPDILRFAAQQLHLENSSLADTFIDYLADRSDTRDKETYCIGLCWEETAWDNAVLTNLENDEIQLERLYIPVICIRDLKILTDQLFNAIGITDIDDDD